MQAVVDYEMSKLPENPSLSILPSKYEEPQLSISRDRANPIEKMIDLDELLEGETTAINFENDSISDYCRENGLNLVERQIAELVGDESLLSPIEFDDISSFAHISPHIIDF